MSIHSSSLPEKKEELLLVLLLLVSIAVSRCDKLEVTFTQGGASLLYYTFCHENISFFLGMTVFDTILIGILAGRAIPSSTYFYSVMYPVAHVAYTGSIFMIVLIPVTRYKALKVEMKSR